MECYILNPEPQVKIYQLVILSQTFDYHSLGNEELQMASSGQGQYPIMHRIVLYSKELLSSKYIKVEKP